MRSIMWQFWKWNEEMGRVVRGEDIPNPQAGPPDGAVRMARVVEEAKAEIGGMFAKSEGCKNFANCKAGRMCVCRSGAEIAFHICTSAVQGEAENWKRLYEAKSLECARLQRELEGRK